MGDIIRSPLVQPVSTGPDSTLERDSVVSREQLSTDFSGKGLHDGPVSSDPAVAAPFVPVPAEPPAATVPEYDPVQLERALAERREAASEEGYREGLKKGEEALRQLLASQQKEIESRVEQLLASMAEEHSRVLRQCEDAVPVIVFAAVARLVGESVIQPDFVTACIRQAIAQSALQAPLTIRLHPDDAEGLVPANWGDERLRIVPDPAVQGGGCLIESDKGDVDAQLTTQLTALKDLLLKVHQG